MTRVYNILFILACMILTGIACRQEPGNGGEDRGFQLNAANIQMDGDTEPAAKAFQDNTKYAIFVINTRVYANMFAMLTYMFASAVSQATQVVVARLMGAEQIEEVDHRVKRTLLASLVISTLVSVVLYLFSTPLLRLFTSDQAVLELFHTIMLIEIPLEIGRAVNIVMCRSLQACGDIRFPIAICVFSAWLTAVGGGLLLSMPMGLGLAGLWIAMACDECLRAVLFLWRWRSRAWCRKRLLSM